MAFSEGPKKEKRAVETERPVERKMEVLETASEAVHAAHEKLLRGQELLQSTNASLTSKREVRSKMDALKRNLARLGAVLALSAPSAMLAHVKWAEQGHDRSSETEQVETPEEMPTETPASRYAVREERPDDAQEQLTQNLLFELAQTLREHEMGIERVSPSELARLTAETALQNALDAQRDAVSGPQLANQIRAEIEGACSLPECNPEEALAAASTELARRAGGEGRFAPESLERNFELLRAQSELGGSSAELAFSVQANRSDLFEEAAMDRLRSSPSPEAAGEGIARTMQAISPFEFALQLTRVDPEVQARVRDALHAHERALTDQRTTLLAAQEAAAAHARMRQETDPFAAPSDQTDRTDDAELRNQVHRIDEQITRIRQALNNVG